jgi:hypothetical protein
VNLYTHRYSFTGWEIGLLKLAMVAFGILVGSAFPEAWRPWTVPLALLFILPAAWLGVSSFRQIAAAWRKA